MATIQSVIQAIKVVKVNTKHVCKYVGASGTGFKYIRKTYIVNA